MVVGGCERVGGFNLPYTECYDPVTGEWKSLAKLPEFTKSEYAVCALRNDILVSGKTPTPTFAVLSTIIRKCSLHNACKVVSHTQKKKPAWYTHAGSLSCHRIPGGVAGEAGVAVSPVLFLQPQSA